MNKSVYYYSVHSGKIIDLSTELADFQELINNYKYNPFSRYEKGFLIFLKPDLLDELDEYINGDPFGMENNVDSPFQLSRTNKTLELLAFIISDRECNNIKILDIGCGQGHITAQIKEKYRESTVSGVDISISAIKKAHSMYHGIQFVVADARNLPYEDSTVDIMVFNNIWEHVADPISMLMKAKRVLKSGGYLILSTPSRFRLSVLLRMIFGKKVNLNPHHVTEYTVGQVIEQLQYSGFSVVSIDSSSYNASLSKLSLRKVCVGLIKKLIDAYIRVIRSDHVIGGTVFFIAKNK